MIGRYSSTEKWRGRNVIRGALHRNNTVIMYCTACSGDVLVEITLFLYMFLEVVIHLLIIWEISPVSMCTYMVCFRHIFCGTKPERSREQQCYVPGCMLAGLIKFHTILH